MKGKAEPTLHIEWSPSSVTALDIQTGRTATAAKLTELASFWNGQKQALVGINRSHIFLKTLRLPAAAPEDLRRLLQVQMGQFFPLPPNQLAFDSLQTTDKSPEGYLTIVAAVRTEDLKRLHSELKQAGLTASRVLPVALGSAAVAARAGLPGALVIEATGDGMALDVVQEGILRFSRLVARGSDPAAEAQRTLAAAQSGHLPLLAAGNLNVPGAQTQAGTALSQLHETPPFRLELAEDRMREAKKLVATRTRFAGFMLTAALLLVTLLWSDRSDKMAVINKGEASWAGQLKKLRSERDRETAKAQKVSTLDATLQRAFGPAQPLSDITAVVSDSLPSGAWLTGLSLERGKPVQIRGTATNANVVGQFVNALGKTPRFRDVKLIFSNSAKIEDKQVVQFNVSAFAVGNLPMPAPEKATAKTKKAPAKTGTPAAADNGKGEPS